MDDYRVYAVEVTAPGNERRDVFEDARDAAERLADWRRLFGKKYVVAWELSDETRKTGRP